MATVESSLVDINVRVAIGTASEVDASTTLGLPVHMSESESESSIFSRIESSGDLSLFGIFSAVAPSEARTAFADVRFVGGGSAIPVRGIIPGGVEVSEGRVLGADTEHEGDGISGSWSCCASLASEKASSRRSDCASDSGGQWSVLSMRSSSESSSNPGSVDSRATGPSIARRTRSLFCCSLAGGPTFRATTWLALGAVPLASRGSITRVRPNDWVPVDGKLAACTGRKAVPFFCRCASASCASASRSAEFAVSSSVSNSEALMAMSKAAASSYFSLSSSILAFEMSMCDS
eukprot:scaffold176966_cov26-Tisochrysis_lutea.AAC.7